MDQEDRVAYASRGPMMATMVEFFEAVDGAMKKFKFASQPHGHKIKQQSFKKFVEHQHVKALHESSGGKYRCGHVLGQNEETGIVTILFDDDCETNDCNPNDVEEDNWTLASGLVFRKNAPVQASLIEWQGTFYNGVVERQNEQTGYCDISFEDGEKHVCSPFLVFPI